MLVESLDRIGVVEHAVVDVPVVLYCSTVQLHPRRCDEVVAAEGLVVVEVELKAIRIVLDDTALTYTAFGQDRVGEGIGIVGVGAQVLIIVAHVGRLHCAHTACQDGVLGVVEEADRIGVLDVGDEGSSQLLENVPSRSPLDAEVAHSLGAAALTELVEDVIGDVVLRVALRGEKSSAGGVGVLDGRGGRIFGGGVFADEVEPDLKGREELVVGTHIPRISVGATPDSPSWVDTCGEGGEEVRLVRPSIEAQRVVVNDGIAVELLEPVGVGSLCPAEVGQSGGFVIG